VRTQFSASVCTVILGQRAVDVYEHATVDNSDGDATEEDFSVQGG
jgi:hypothetical protein